MGKRVVVVGTQWGDEGKGKVTDYLANMSDVVVRSQGGNNAGHTIIFNNNKYALHLLPSGIFKPEIKNIMANGMVINPEALIQEIDILHNRGITDYKLYISDRAHVVMPYHIEIDSLIEDIKGDLAVGTTKKGIGPAYADKISRIGIRMSDLLDEETLKHKLSISIKFANILLKSQNHKTYNVEDLLPQFLSYGNRLKQYICDTSVLLNNEIDSNRNILFEGAQGSMLCIENGTYPYVTSSSPTAASIPLNTGIAPWTITDVIGVTKAYTTRVGEGVFPTEFNDKVSDKIREVGKEYGTTTGRPRRIGWLDMVVLKHVKRINGLTGLGIMLLDVLSGLETIKICNGYILDGLVIDHIPANYEEYKRCIPVYKELPGWQEDISNIKKYEDLPHNCQKYLATIENILGVDIALISVGPDRKQTMMLKKIF